MSALCEMFGVQLYKNNAHVLLSRISSILNLCWLQHAHSVRGVYECLLTGELQLPSPLGNSSGETFTYMDKVQADKLHYQQVWFLYKAHHLLQYQIEGQCKVLTSLVQVRLLLTWTRCKLTSFTISRFGSCTKPIAYFITRLKGNTRY